MNQLSQVIFHPKADQSTPAPILLTVIDTAHAVPDVAMLLPEHNYNQCLIKALKSAKKRDLPKKAVAGLFLSDPFLHLPTCLEQLTALGISTVANFPSVAFYGGEFSSQLSDVGLGLAEEFKALSMARDLGFQTITCIASSHEEDGMLSNQSNNTWLIHGGIENMISSLHSSDQISKLTNTMSGDKYLYQPEVAMDSLPEEYFGVAKAQWWTAK